MSNCPNCGQPMPDPNVTSITVTRYIPDSTTWEYIERMQRERRKLTP